jgi:hypothetical protein
LKSNGLRPLFHTFSSGSPPRPSEPPSNEATDVSIGNSSPEGVRTGNPVGGTFHYRERLKSTRPPEKVALPKETSPP